MTQLWEAIEQFNAEDPKAVKEVIQAALGHAKPVQALTDFISLSGCPSGTLGILEEEMSQSDEGSLALLSRCYPHFKKSGSVSLNSLLERLSPDTPFELAALPNALIEQVSVLHQETPVWSRDLQNKINGDPTARGNLLQAVRGIAQGDPETIRLLFTVFPTLLEDAKVLDQMVLIIVQTASEQSMTDKLEVLGQERVRNSLDLVRKSPLVTGKRLKTFETFINKEIQNEEEPSPQTKPLEGDKTTPSHPLTSPPPTSPLSSSVPPTAPSSSVPPPPPSPPPPPPPSSSPLIPPPTPPIFQNQNMGSNLEKTTQLLAQISKGDFKFKPVSERVIGKKPLQPKSGATPKPVDPQSLLEAVGEHIAQLMGQHPALMNESSGSSEEENKTGVPDDTADWSD